MKKIKTLITSGGAEIIPFFDAPLFLKHQYESGKIIFGYELFIIIPGKVTLPIVELFFELSDPKSSPLERMGLGIMEAIDSEKVRQLFKKTLKSYETIGKSKRMIENDLSIEKYKYWYSEGLKYINGEKSDAVVGFEFIFE